MLNVLLDIKTTHRNCQTVCMIQLIHISCVHHRAISLFMCVLAQVLVIKVHERCMASRLFSVQSAQIIQCLHAFIIFNLISSASHSLSVNTLLSYTKQKVNEHHGSASDFRATTSFHVLQYHITMQ
jgi:hypothetical protein